jgi:triosephosphate isomerase
MQAEKPFFAANWKMHLGPVETAAFAERFTSLHSPRPDARVVFFPPSLSIAAFREATAERPDLEVGVQDVHEAAAGAHTGAISADMARQAGAQWVLAGHSERRREFGDDDARVAAKVEQILEQDLRPVVCFGETLEEREDGLLEAVLDRQVRVVLERIGEEAGERLTYAYEPVWAIGTGRTASPADAADAHAIAREAIGRHGGVPDSIILYGGSVKPDNIEQLLRAPGVDGVLVGGASLDAGSFAAICAAGG